MSDEPEHWYMRDAPKHCCFSMDSTLDQEEISSWGELLEYDPSVRSYNFLLYKNNKYYGTRYQLKHCPWCGTKLPEDLGDEWEEALKTEYNLTINDFVDKKGRWDESRIPEEFRTDEWWKKRGL